ncbi:MAG: NADH-quinone oxidoreductase subunit A [Acidobacteria bacterium RBG_16_68_9]|nr:MAG: NADH-quinone oxidoreductase subunit A [Acidobacteria bacterium RBG_16_68_9]
MATQYVPVIVMFALAGVVVLTFFGLGRLLGPRNPTAIKLTTFECGNEPSGSAWGRFSVKFYLTAILFIVFDVEVVFLYPWAVLFRRLGWFGFAEMAIFIAILTVGLLYVWRRGALEWE